MHGEKRTWEYLRRDPANADLNALGAEGWGLVSTGSVLIFKRPAPGFRARVTLDQKRAVYERFDRPWPPASQRGKGV
jgi:hypothetical protein